MILLLLSLLCARQICWAVQTRLGMKEELVRVLQTSISPVVLISGIGLLMLSFTNRFGRVIDRVRQLLAELPKRSENQQAGLREQIDILYRRALFLRLSITWASISVFGVAFLILFLFLYFAVGEGFRLLVVGAFLVMVLSLVFSLVYFIRDIGLSLVALKKELGDNVPTKVKK